MKQTHSLVSVPEISGLKPKSLRRAYDVKAYVMLFAIRPYNEQVRPGVPFSAFLKEWLISAPGFTFIFPYLTFITHV